MSKLVEEGYDKIAIDYDSNRVSLGCDEELMINEFIKYLPIDGSVLDVGCGNGLVAKRLFDNGFKVIGIDLSNEMLKIARLNVPGVEFIKKDMTKLGFLDDSFNGVISLFSIINVSRSMHERVIKSFYRILRPGGVLLISTGDGDGEVVRDFMSAKMFFSIYCVDEFIKLLVRAGFKVLKKLFTKSPLLVGGVGHYLILAKKH